MTRFSGNTEDAGAPVLAQAFWTKGRSLSGKVASFFTTQNGECMTILLAKEITLEPAEVSPRALDPQKVRAVSVGLSMKGLAMALRASGAGHFEINDVVDLTCTGSQSTGKANDMTNFKVAIDRP